MPQPKDNLVKGRIYVEIERYPFQGLRWDELDMIGVLVVGGMPEFTPGW